MPAALSTDNHRTKPDAHATTHTDIDLDHDRDLRHNLHPDFDLDLGDDLDQEFDLNTEFDLDSEIGGVNRRSSGKARGTCNHKHRH